MPHEMRVQFLPKNLAFMAWYAEVLKQTTYSRHCLSIVKMIKSPFLDIIHEAWKKSPEDATRFFLQVRDPHKYGGLGGATGALHNALDVVCISPDQPSPGARIRPKGMLRSGHWLTWATVKAWNQWQENDKKPLKITDPSANEPGLVMVDGWVVDFDRNVADLVFFPKREAAA